MTPTEKLKQGAASNPAVMRREKDKATAAAKTKGMFERAAQRRAGDEKTKEAKAVAKLESDLAALDAKMKPMLDKGGLIKKGLHSEYSKLVDEANTIRNQLTQLELARKGIQVPSPKQGPRKPTGKEKIDTQLAKRAQSEHESIKRLIKDGFLDRDSGGREEMMKLLGLTQREINFELAGRNLDDRDLYYMSNKDFGKLVLGLSQDRLKKNSR